MARKWEHIDWTKVRDKAVKTAKAKVTSHQDAEDIAQEVLVKLLSQKEIENPEAYAYVATKTACIDFYRLRKRRNECPLKSPDLEDPILPTTFSKIVISQLWSHISSEQQDMMTLKITSNLSEKEIAQKCQINLSTLKTRIRAVRQKLKMII